MPETAHKRIHSGSAPCLPGVLLQPLSKGGIQSFVLGPRHKPRLLD